MQQLDQGDISMMTHDRIAEQVQVELVQVQEQDLIQDSLEEAEVRECLQD